MSGEKQDVDSKKTKKNLKIITQPSKKYIKLVRQSQIVQSVMYSYDAVISSYKILAIYSWFCKSARDFDDET